MMCYVADAESGTKTTFVATNLDMRGRECVRNRHRTGKTAFIAQSKLRKNEFDKSFTTLKQIRVY